MTRTVWDGWRLLLELGGTQSFHSDSKGTMEGIPAQRTPTSVQGPGVGQAEPSCSFTVGYAVNKRTYAHKRRLECRERGAAMKGTGSGSKRRCVDRL